MQILTKLEKRLKRKIERADWKRILHFGAWAALIAIAFFSVLFFLLTRDLPSPEEITTRAVSESTKIYDRTGTILLYEVSGGQKRTVVPLSDIPQTLRDATIATEDQDFYSEPAFDIKGIARAVFQNIIHAGAVQGASTITQQLARNAFLSSEKTLTRKLKELILAVELNRYYTKDKILELYLNEIPYGPNIYGVEAASQAYFSKPVSDLSLGESAILAALPQAPSRYSPWGIHVDLLLKRQKDVVLPRMLSTGRITRSQYETALAEPIIFAEPNLTGIKAPHFALAVRDYLIEKYGEDVVRTGGLRVKTTLDWDLQQTGERVVAEGAARNEKLFGGGNAALVAEDASTGQILAMVGSRNYFDKAAGGNFNVATQGLRQPGSALKPFVYLAGFTKGYTPDTILFDAPTEFSTNAACPAVPDLNKSDSRCFHPQDFEGYFQGPMTVRHALAQSVNVPAVQMLYLDNKKYAIDIMQSFGLKTLDDPNKYGLSLVLGGGAVHLIDLVRAYSVLAEDGVARDQTFVLEVRDKSNNVLEEYQEASTRVIDAQPVRLTNDILSDADARAGLFQSSFDLTVYPGYDVAMKTGTSNDYKDAWTIGYTPSLVVGVWAGNNDNTAMHRQGSSILAAVPMWHNFMVEALKKQPLETFPKPDPVTPSKPILNGQFVQPDGSVHSILYYVDTEDPTGPPPSNPARDPQFNNWETTVQIWTASHPVAPPEPVFPFPGDASSTTSTWPFPTSTGPQFILPGPGFGEGTSVGTGTEP